MTMHDVFTFGILFPIGLFLWFAVGYIVFLFVETITDNFRKK